MNDKHLPPRSCQVLFQSDPKDKPCWIQVDFESADYEGPMWDGEDVVTRGHDDQWRISYSSEVLDVEHVIMWRELEPESYLSEETKAELAKWVDALDPCSKLYGWRELKAELAKLGVAVPPELEDD